MNTLNPIFQQLFHDMSRVGLLPEHAAPVIDLHAERVRREREASERRHREAHGEWTPSGDAA
jgi:hypothetical protein